jgi:hypothetical protein
MNQKTLLALAAFAVLGIIAIVALRRPEKGERPSDRPRPMAKIESADLDTLELTRQGVTVVLKREGGKYKVTAPVAAAADEANAKAVFEAMEKLDITDLVTEQKAKQAEFQVDDANGIHVVAKNGKAGGKVLADLLFGKSTGSGTMVRPAGKDEIWQASGSLRYTVDKSTADWRDRSVTTFTAGDAEKIEVKAKDGSKIALTKKGKEGNEDKWEVADGSVKVDKLDMTVPNGVVSALSSFKTNEFADGAKPADTGLDAPALTVTVSLKGGKTAALQIGNKKGEEDYYAKTPDSAQVLVVKKYNLDRINKYPVDFRDKTICDIPMADLGEIAVANGDKSFTISKSGDSWKASKPAKLEVDTSKVNPFAGGLKEWKASSFAVDATVKGNGLAKPKVISAKAAAKPGTKGGAACTLKIGDETKDKQSYYVQTGKSADIYVVPKWSVDRFLVKPDDLKKGAAPAAPGPHGNPHASN